MKPFFTFQYPISQQRKSIFCITVLTLFFAAGYCQLDHSMIRLYKSGENIFPSEWQSDKIQAKATIAHNERSYALNELEKALGKYPKDFDTRLKNVFLLGNFLYMGQKYPAAHSDENIYIGIRHNNEVEKSFHREFFEILLKNNGANFNSEEWKNLAVTNRKHDDAYTTNNIFSAEQLNPLLFGEGFLSNYSLTGWENDVAVYAENLFAGGREFWKIVNQYPLIRKKTMLVIKFYHSLNPVYTENWFRFISDFRLF